MIYRIIIILLIDLLSKKFISLYINLNESYEIIENFFSITYVRNTGAAWSIFAGKSFLIIIISVVIIGGLIWYVYNNLPNSKLEKYGYELVFGGAIGNLFERIFLGYVTDFLDFNIFGYDYPIFNFADCFIVIGIGLLLMDAWRCKR